ncbi:MAG: flagellar basal body-associated protein FliL [Alphaproteobacteria bacterium]|jgi:flagellar FliL protein
MAKKPTKEDAEQEGAEEGAPEGGKSKKKLFIIIGAAVVLLGGGGGGAYFMFLKPKPEAANVVKVEAAKPVSFVDLPDMTVNLSTGQDRPAYLRVKAALEVSDNKVADQIKPVMPRVVDAFQVFLREMRPADLEGSAGMYRLRDELTRRVNAAVHPARVNAVLFRELLVQ